MLERVKNKSIEQIAKDYNCSSATVRHYLAYARQHDLVVNQARLIVGDVLVPLALAVYEAQLHDGNLQAAQDILFGSGILQRVSNIKHAPADNDDLDAFRTNYFKAVDAIANAQPAELISNESEQRPSGREPDLHDQADGNPERLPGEGSKPPTDSTH